MALGAYDIKPAKSNHPFVFLLPLPLTSPCRIPTQHNINTTPGHIGGHGYRPRLPCLGNNTTLFNMLFGIKHLAGNTLLFQKVSQVLRLLNRYGAHKHRSFLLVKLLNLLNHSPEFGLLILVNPVRVVLPNHGFIGRDNYHIKVIYLVKLFSLGNRSAGHPRQPVIHAKVVLDGDGGKGSAFSLNPDTLLGFYCLM
ncbi:hypothetical protein ES703_92167 [subsurface metagenome]